MIELWTYPGTVAAAGTRETVTEAVERGVDGLSLSSHVHSARIFQPRERSMVRWAGGCWFEPDRDRFGAIQPPTIDHATGGSADLLADTATAAGEAGLGVSAWTVVGHGSQLGAQNPAYRTQDAFGVPHDHAPCFSHPEVRSYVARLAAAVSERPVEALDLESVRELSVFHGHDAVAGHEASAVPAGDTARRLYSQCFCDACRRVAVDGVAPTSEGAESGPAFDAEPAFDSEEEFDAARDRVRELVGEPLADPTARLPALETLVQREPTLASLFRLRTQTVGATLAAAAAGSSVPVDVQIRGAEPNRWQGRRLADLNSHADRLTVRCYGLGPDDAADRVRRVTEAADATVNAAVRFDSFDDGDRFVETVERVRDVVDRAVRVYSLPTATETHLDWLDRVTD
ncbi:MAG: hypothetical protein ABEI75_00665 [Halobaculum sp.]